MMKWDELWRAYELELQLQSFKPKTIYTHHSYFKTFVNYLNANNITKVRDLSKSELRDYTFYLKEAGYKLSTVNVYNAGLVKLIRHLKDEEILTQTDEANIRRIKSDSQVINTFTNEEAKTLSMAWNPHSKTYSHSRNYAIVNLLLDTGLRVAEVCNLKTENLKDNYLEVVAGKGNKNRIVPYSLQLQKIINRYLRQRQSFLERRERESDYLFISRNCNKLTTTSLYEMTTLTGQMIGLRGDCKSNPHNFRHYYCTRLLMNGLDLYSVSKIMGHSNLQTTQVYLDSLKQDEIVANAMKYTILKHL